VGLPYLLVGFVVGMAMAVSARSIMNSLPIAKAGIGSAVNDLTRDFGGAIGIAVMGALLAIRYTNYFTKAFASLPAEQAQNLSQQVATTMSKSFAGAAQVAQQYSSYSAQILNATKTAFLQGQDAAYLVGIIAAIVAVLFVLFVYPNKTGEDATFAEVAREEEAVAAAP